MVIFLYGPDTYRSHQRYLRLRDAFRVKFDPLSFNVSSVDAATFDADAFHSSVGSAGFLSKKRFFALNGLIGQSKSSSPQEAVIETLTGTSWTDENILVVIEGDLGATYNRKKRTVVSKGGPLLEWLLKHATVEEFPLLAGEALNEWIREFVKAKGGRIAAEATQEIAALVGSDLWQMSNELAKLLAVKRGEPITAEDVRSYVRGRFDENIFHFTDALAARDERESLRLLLEQVEAGANVLYLLAMLTRQFRLLILAKEIMAREPNPATVATRLKVHPFVARKAIQSARRFDPDELPAIFHAFFELDWKCKTSRGDPVTLLTLFVRAVCRGVRELTPIRPSPAG